MGLTSLRKLLGNTWYAQQIMVIPYNHDPINIPTVDAFKEIALYTGTNYLLKNDLLKKDVMNIGVIEDYLVIEVL